MGSTRRADGEGHNKRICRISSFVWLWASRVARVAVARAIRPVAVSPVWAASLARSKTVQAFDGGCCGALPTCWP